MSWRSVNSVFMLQWVYLCSWASEMLEHDAVSYADEKNVIVDGRKQNVLTADLFHWLLKTRDGPASQKKTQKIIRFFPPTLARR
jgi:hypothetical protein